MADRRSNSAGCVCRRAGCAIDHPLAAPAWSDIMITYKRQLADEDLTTITTAPAPRASGSGWWVAGLRWLLPQDDAQRAAMRLGLVRVLIAANLVFGLFYLSWRYMASINWAAWPVALLLLTAETYSYLDSWLFGLTIWGWKQRPAPPAPPEDATVDVFITCYNEPVELVRETAIAALAITWSHETYILDDGSSPAMRAMAAEIGAR